MRFQYPNNLIFSETASPQSLTSSFTRLDLGTAIRVNSDLDWARLFDVAGERL
ncbi:MAG TPA: hypothetical protein VLA51_00405 [Paracoccaceae bacterium]|nr:hypothetical protein [Paracoccaceae bacterium]